MADAWEHGVPVLAYNGPFCHSGENCWGTRLSNTYPPCSSSALMSPAIDLTPCLGANGALVPLAVKFYHTYVTYSLSDGCAVQISGNGEDWEAVNPNPYYTAMISTNGYMECATLAAICGSPGWEGDLQGQWLQVTFEIPEALYTSEFRFRFLFGSNALMNMDAIGWYIDDVEIAIK